MLNPAMAGKQELDAIGAVLQAYFDGLCEGDMDKLRPAFHENAGLNAAGVRRGRDQYVKLVTSYSVPKYPVASPEHMAGRGNLQSRRRRYELRTALQA